MVADISNAPARSYDAVDADDQQATRPDFALALYPGHLWDRGKPGLALDAEVRIANCEGLSADLHPAGRR